MRAPDPTALSRNRQSNLAGAQLLGVFLERFDTNNCRASANFQNDRKIPTGDITWRTRASQRGTPIRCSSIDELLHADEDV